MVKNELCVCGGECVRVCLKIYSGEGKWKMGGILPLSLLYLVLIASYSSVNIKPNFFFLVRRRDSIYMYIVYEEGH